MRLPRHFVPRNDMDMRLPRFARNDKSILYALNNAFISNNLMIENR
jgi:hypothetical protein